jgi:hypothetical protein
MLKFNAEVKLVDILDREYLAELDAVLEVELKRAVGEWLRTILSIVPVYTGTTKGTFGMVGRIVSKYTQGINFQSPGPNTTGKKYFVYPKNGKKWPLGYAQGLSYSGPPSFTKHGSAGNRLYLFEFSNYLPYQSWNDMLPGPSWINFKVAPPWRHLQKGALAFKKYAETIPKRFPELAQFIRIRVIQVR